MRSDAISPWSESRSLAQPLVAEAPRALAEMYLPTRRAFSFTGRRTTHGLTREGVSLRYTAIAALGLATLDQDAQGEALAGELACDLVDSMVSAAHHSEDPGAVALTAWASAEIASRSDPATLDRLGDLLASGSPLPTVDVSWMLTASVAAGLTGAAAAVAEHATRRLLAAQGPAGLFPHALPAASLGRFRAHVGCFADQVYPIQALARYAAATGFTQALAAADDCATAICRLQGEAGQWWWHYDSRSDRVVEGYPVYSVHQHAMAPMALKDLVSAGGVDCGDAVRSGLSWLVSPPEVSGGLIDSTRGVVWRKVGRREPAKAVRKANAALSSVLAGARVPWAERFFPTSVIDHECRPYELGWLLYAWNRT